MSNLSDKDIDRLSRDAAEFYEPDDSMLSWSKLEQQLVKHIPERPPDSPSFFRIRALIWGPSVLLLAGITYLIIKNAAYRTDSTLKTQTESLAVKPADQALLNGNDSTRNAPAHAVNPQGGETDPANGESNSGNVNPDQTNPGVKVSPEAGGIGSVVNPLAGNGNSRNNSSGEIISGKNSSATGQRNQNSHTNNNSTSLKDLSNSDNELNNSDASRNAAGGSAAGNSGAAEKRIAADHRAAVQLPLPMDYLTRPEVRGNDALLNRFAGRNNTDKQPDLKSLQINHSLVIGLVMGPDYTDAGSVAGNQPGNNIGISLGYYLMKRLSINTGFQYTTKYYWSDGKPFQPQPPRQTIYSYIASYAAFPEIELVKGQNSLFEIPLSLRYDVYQHEKLRLFVNAGFSSYLLQKQQYTYFFHNRGGAYELQNQNNNHQNYWFAIGNISAGIEQDLGKGFSFQAEPFVRLPFRGVGVGNLKLNSYGMLFSIRYSPVIGRKKN